MASVSREYSAPSICVVARHHAPGTFTVCSEEFILRANPGGLSVPRVPYAGDYRGRVSRCLC